MHSKGFTVYFFVTALLVFPSLRLQAQTEHTPPDSVLLSQFYDMSLEQLDSVKALGVSSELEKFISSLISVATKKSLSARNTPGIVTLITEEEIRRSGAHDMIDVLRLVPGFDLALDEEGRIGIGIRGNWANEGKVLLMIDGQEMNEIYTANLYLGNHYPVNFIKRIEIIRGPGSVTYGGFAAFGVINIITKGADELSGISVGATGGLMRKTYGSRNTEWYIGKKWKNASFSLSHMVGKGQRSDRQHFGFYGSEWADSLGAGAYSSLAGNSELRPSFTNIAFNWKKLSVRSINDFYEATNITLIDNNKHRPSVYGVQTSYNELKYVFRINNKLQITPRLNFIFQFPQLRNAPDSTNLQNRKNYISRSRGNITASYDPTHRSSFIGGVDYFNDFARDNPNGIFVVGDEDVSYHNFAAFAQGMFNLPFAHLTAGARYDWNTSFGSAFVPRLGLTKRLRDNHWHFKLLLSGAFRAPSIGNVVHSFNGNYTFPEDKSCRCILIEKGIKPERTLVMEAEVGYQLNSKMLITANIYNIIIRDPIVFTYYQDELIQQTYGENAGVNVYRNYPKTGTSGLELDLRFRDHWGYVTLNYSHYSLESKPRIPAYSVSTFDLDINKRTEVDPHQVLGLANNKLNLNATYYILKNFAANVTSTLYGARYGYDVLVTGPGKYDIGGRLIKREPTLLTNVYLSYDNLFTNGLNAGIGVYNVFNSNYEFLQPFFGLNTPVPGPSIELIAKASYSFPFRNKKKQAKAEKGQ
jgi:outer membrane receptor for ferrienterochelin and colicin